MHPDLLTYFNDESLYTHIFLTLSLHTFHSNCPFVQSVPYVVVVLSLFLLTYRLLPRPVVSFLPL